MENRRRFSRLGLLLSVPALVAAVAVGWYLLSPLFIDQQVEEAFPAVTVVPTATAAVEVANSEVVTASAAVEDVPTPAPTAEPEPEATPVVVTESEPVRLLGGMFVDADAVHRGMGEAAIYELADGQRVLRFENFEVTNGPDLYVVLSGHPAPRSGDQLHSDGDFEVARLKGNVGSQNYELPADLDLSAFRSVVIYCKRFSVVFSTAELGG